MDPLVTMGLAILMVVVGVAYLNKGVISTILALVIALALGLVSLFVLEPLDEGLSLGDYLASPDKPVLVVLQREQTVVAAGEVKADEVLWVIGQMAEISSDDPDVRSAAEKAIEDRFGIDATTVDIISFVGRVMGQTFAPLDATREGTVAAWARSGDWDDAADDYARTIVVDLVRLEPHLPSGDDVEIGVKLEGEVYPAVIRVDALRDCVLSPDCADRLQAALKQPSLFVRRFGEITDVDHLEQRMPGFQKNLDSIGATLPRNVVANIGLLGYLTYLGIQDMDLPEKVELVQELVSSGVVVIEPPSDIFDLVAAIIDKVPASSLPGAGG